jgi:hypothetical protein
MSLNAINTTSRQANGFYRLKCRHNIEKLEERVNSGRQEERSGRKSLA